MVNILDNNIEDKERHELNESNINYNELSEESDNDINYDLNEDSVNHKNVMKTKLSNDVLLEKKINNKGFIEEIDVNNQLIKVFRIKENNSIHSFGCNSNQCLYINKLRDLLLSHIRTKHTFEKRYNCKECDFKTHNKTYFSRHKKSIHSLNTKIFKCDFTECGFETKYKYTITCHMNRHKGIKPHACLWSGCESSFTTSSELKTHMNSHSNEKTYSCDWTECEAKFGTNEKLERHKVKHSEYRKYVCDWPQCIFKGRFPSDLIRHKRIHSGLKPYSCDWTQCKAKFTQKDHLNRHKAIHTGHTYGQLDVCLPLARMSQKKF